MQHSSHVADIGCWAKPVSTCRQVCQPAPTTPGSGDECSLATPQSCSSPDSCSQAVSDTDELQASGQSSTPSTASSDTCGAGSSRSTPELESCQLPCCTVPPGKQLPSSPASNVAAVVLSSCPSDTDEELDASFMPPSVVWQQLRGNQAAHVHPLHSTTSNLQAPTCSSTAGAAKDGLMLRPPGMLLAMLVQQADQARKTATLREQLVSAPMANSSSAQQHSHQSAPSGCAAAAGDGMRQQQHASASDAMAAVAADATPLKAPRVEAGSQGTVRPGEGAAASAAAAIQTDALADAVKAPSQLLQEPVAEPLQWGQHRRHSGYCDASCVVLSAGGASKAAKAEEGEGHRAAAGLECQHPTGEQGHNAQEAGWDQQPSEPHLAPGELHAAVQPTAVPSRLSSTVSDQGAHLHAAEPAGPLLDASAAQAADLPAVELAASAAPASTAQPALGDATVGRPASQHAVGRACSTAAAGPSSSAAEQPSLLQVQRGGEATPAHSGRHAPAHGSGQASPQGSQQGSQHATARLQRKVSNLVTLWEQQIHSHAEEGTAADGDPELVPSAGTPLCRSRSSSGGGSLRSSTGSRWVKLREAWQACRTLAAAVHAGNGREIWVQRGREGELLSYYSSPAGLRAVGLPADGTEAEASPGQLRDDSSRSQLPDECASPQQPQLTAQSQPLPSVVGMEEQLAACSQPLPSVAGMEGHELEEEVQLLVQQPDVDAVEHLQQLPVEHLQLLQREQQSNHEQQQQQQQQPGGAEPQLLHGDLQQLYDELQQLYGPLPLLHGDLPQLHGDLQQLYEELQLLYGDLPWLHADQPAMHQELQHEVAQQVQQAQQPQPQPQPQRQQQQQEQEVQSQEHLQHPLQPCPLDEHHQPRTEQQHQQHQHLQQQQVDVDPKQAALVAFIRRHHLDVAVSARIVGLVVAPRPTLVLPPKPLVGAARPVLDTAQPATSACRQATGLQVAHSCWVGSQPQDQQQQQPPRSASLPGSWPALRTGAALRSFALQPSQFDVEAGEEWQPLQPAAHAHHSSTCRPGEDVASQQLAAAGPPQGLLLQAPSAAPRSAQGLDSIGSSAAAQTPAAVTVPLTPARHMSVGSSWGTASHPVELLEPQLSAHAVPVWDSDTLPSHALSLGGAALAAHPVVLLPAEGEEPLAVQQPAPAPTSAVAGGISSRSGGSSSAQGRVDALSQWTGPVVRAAATAGPQQEQEGLGGTSDGVPCDPQQQLLQVQRAQAWLAQIGATVGDVVGLPAGGLATPSSSAAASSTSSASSSVSSSSSQGSRRRTPMSYQLDVNQLLLDEEEDHAGHDVCLQARVVTSGALCAQDKLRSRPVLGDVCDDLSVDDGEGHLGTTPRRLGPGWLLWSLLTAAPFWKR